MDAMDGQLVWREVFEKRSRPVCGPPPSGCWSCFFWASPWIFRFTRDLNAAFPWLVKRIFLHDLFKIILLRGAPVVPLLSFVQPNWGFSQIRPSHAILNCPTKWTHGCRRWWGRSHHWAWYSGTSEWLHISNKVIKNKCSQVKSAISLSQILKSDRDSKNVSWVNWNLLHSFTCD